MDVAAALPPLPPDVEAAAYRIAQEALTNVIRHAGAEQRAAHLVTENDTLRVEVTDDGHGFTPAQRPGVGLASMRHRAEILGGTFDVTTGDAGTSIVASPPAGGSNMTPPVRVVIADDHPMFRYGLRAVLAAADEVDVVGDAADGSELVALVEHTQPDVVLTDLAMPGLDGANAARQIIAAFPVTIEYGHSLGELVTAAVNAGLVIEHLGEHVAVESDIGRRLLSRDEDGLMRWRQDRELLPIIFSLRARKPH